MTRSVCELLPAETCDLYRPRSAPGDSRTSLKQYILDPVLPVLALLSMSALTLVMLVAIVTAVADMDLELSNGSLNLDPLSISSAEPVGAFRPDQATAPDLAAAPITTDSWDSRTGTYASHPFQSMSLPHEGF